MASGSTIRQRVGGPDFLETHGDLQQGPANFAELMDLPVILFKLIMNKDAVGGEEPCLHMQLAQVWGSIGGALRDPNGKLYHIQAQNRMCRSS